MADHLAFKLSEAATADADAELATLVGEDSTNNQYAAMVSVNIDQLDPTATYTLRAYSDREEKEDPIYEGQINVIYGIFGEGTQPEPIAVRTMGTKDATGRGCPAPQQITRKNGSNLDLFELTKETPTDGKFTYTYKLSDAAPESVEGKINYYVLGDTSMTPLVVDGNDSVTIAKDKSTIVDVPSIVSSKGVYYRTLTVGNDVKLSYPGMSEASVFVKELTGDWAAGAPYTAHINYVDEDGKGITPSGMTDQLAVTKPYTYTAPNRVYVVQDDGTVVEYELSENGTLTFNLGVDESAQTANVKYRKVNTFTEKTWVIKFIDGSEANHGNELQPSIVVTADQLDANGLYALPESINGLVPTQAKIDLASYSGSVIEVYYVPEGQERSIDPYDITVNFVNIADNSVISSQQATVNLVGPNSLSAYDLDLAVPRSFAQDGVEWVILPGQLSGGPETYHLYHGYYAREYDSAGNPKPVTYTVFFRDVNDDLHEATVITRVVTVYDDVVVTDLGTTTTGTTGTTTTGTTTAAAGTAGTDTGTAAADNGTANATLTNNGGVQTVGNQNGQGTTIVRDDGTTTGTERITEDQTPLASPDGTNAANPTDAAQTTNVSTGATFGIIGGIAGIGALLAVLFARKANVEEKAQNKDQDQS